MPSLREAAQQALEALEYGQHTLKQVGENQWESRGQLAMEALKAALETQSTHSTDCYKWHHECAIAEVESVRKGQEPVAHCTLEQLVYLQRMVPSSNTIPLYTQPQPKAEPLTEVEIIGKTCECIDDGTFEMACAIDFARAIERAHGIGGSE